MVGVKCAMQGVLGVISTAQFEAGANCAKSANGVQFAEQAVVASLAGL